MNYIDFDTILQVAEEYKSFLATLPGAKSVDDDFEMGKDEISVQIDRAKLARAGLSYRDVAGEIRYAFEGGIATTIQKSDEEIEGWMRDQWRWMTPPRKTQTAMCIYRHLVMAL